MTLQANGNHAPAPVPTVEARQMLTGPRDAPGDEPERHELECMRLAIEFILSWPCPDCGQPYPCPCDEAPLTDADMALLDLCRIM
jgi:hypothetical protein